MANSNSSPTSVVADVINAFSLELAFAEPGKDTGLLPINNFLLQVEEYFKKNPSPPEIANALKLARAAVDKVFDTTAKFDAPTLEFLSSWSSWMATVFERLEKNHPLPATPESWGKSAATATAPVPLTDVKSVAPAASAVSPSVTSAPSAPAEDTVSPLTLNLDSDRELLSEFINESQEHLANIENGVLVLEDDCVGTTVNLAELELAANG